MTTIKGNHFQTQYARKMLIVDTTSYCIPTTMLWSRHRDYAIPLQMRKMIITDHSAHGHCSNAGQ